MWLPMCGVLSACGHSQTAVGKLSRSIRSRRGCAPARPWRPRIVRQEEALESPQLAKLPDRCLVEVRRWMEGLKFGLKNPRSNRTRSASTPSQQTSIMMREATLRQLSIVCCLGSSSFCVTRVQLEVLLVDVLWILSGRWRCCQVLEIGNGPSGKRLCVKDEKGRGP